MTTVSSVGGKTVPGAEAGRRLSRVNVASGRELAQAVVEGVAHGRGLIVREFGNRDVLRGGQRHSRASKEREEGKMFRELQAREPGVGASESRTRGNAIRKTGVKS